MGHYEKLYNKMKNNPKNVRFKDIEKLLIKVGGFDSRPGKGDHYVFTHPDLEDKFTIDTRGNRSDLKSIYVKNALNLFDKVCPNYGKGE